MRKFWTALALLLCLVVVLVPAPAQSAPAATVMNCRAAVIGSSVQVLCYMSGVLAFSTKIPLNLPPPVTVTLPAPPKVTVTAKVNVPGPTRTVEVKVPGSKETVTVKLPGDTITKTVTKTVPQQGKTVTVTKSPNAGPTPDARPTQSVTRTTSSEKVSPRAGQSGGPNAKMDEGTNPGFLNGPIDFTDEKTTPKEIGVGVLSLLALMGIVLAGMYAGYILGYKESKDASTNMWRALRDELIPRGKHR